MSLPTDASNESYLQVFEERPGLVSLLGAGLLFAAFPPLGWAGLAWVALLPWCGLILARGFQGRRAWLKIWLGGVAFWAAATWFVCIPHWMLSIAWVLMFLYLSIYPLLFIWLGRILVHDHRVPAYVAIPVAWVALEWARAHMLTGYGFNMLANTQFRWPLTLQICDIAGGYGLSFLMAATSAGVATLLLGGRRGWWGLVAAVVSVAIVFGYGNWRLDQLRGELAAAAKEASGIRFNLIQGNIDTRFPETQQEWEDYEAQRFLDYQRLHNDAAADPAFAGADAWLWPEGKYPVLDVFGRDESPNGQQIQQDFQRYLATLERPLGRPLIAGCTSAETIEARTYNAALVIENGGVRDRYFKMHRVVMGEYVPLQEQFPVLNSLSPIGRGINAGERPIVFDIAGKRVMPTICFESVVTHHVRECMGRLKAAGEDPDVMINLTDDGWFYGMTALDHHLACNVMRAVEMRRPMVVAANTGLSANIALTGEIVDEGPRRREWTRQVTAYCRPITSLYRTLGDWPPLILTVVCLLAIVTRTKRRSEKPV